VNVRRDILTAISEGLTTPEEITVRLKMVPLGFNSSTAFMVRQEWLAKTSDPSTGLTHYHLTELGKEKLKNSATEFPSETHEKKRPDFERMRDHLNLSAKTSKAQIISQWNDTTEYYVPYENESEKPLRLLTEL